MMGIDGLANQRAGGREMSSLVPRRVLGYHLRVLRNEAALNANTAAKVLGWSEVKLWRVEKGISCITAMEAQATCETYHAPHDLTCALTELARRSKESGWWHSYSNALPEHFSISATLQEMASDLLGFAPCEVPELLRTESYARVIMRRTHGRNSGQLARECLDRQSLISRADAPLQATFTLAESLTRHPVGGPAVMAGQLRHLAEIADLPNVRVRVVPFSAGQHPGLRTGPFTLMRFPPRGPTETSTMIVHTAALTGELFLDRPHEVDRYHEAHATILGCSLDQAATQDLLNTAAKDLEQ